MTNLAAPSALLLDTKTSGLYLENLKMDDPQQPWVPSLAAALITKAGTFVSHMSFLIKAEGRKIKANAFNEHGITDVACSQYGVPEPRVLGLLTDLLKTAPMSALRVVTYGDLDPKILGSLLARFAISQNKPSTTFDRLWLARPGIELIDIMKPYAQQVCKLPPTVEGLDYKWPSLSEAAEIVLARPPRPGLSDAWDDLLTLRDLYVTFDRRGFFNRGAVS